jgi:hypothetical protein
MAKPGPKPKPAAERRSHPVLVKLNVEERRILERAAKGAPLARTVRELAIAAVKGRRAR